MKKATVLCALALAGTVLLGSCAAPTAEVGAENGNLMVVNHSDGPIYQVTYETEGSSGGAALADGSALSKGERLGFDLPEETVEVLLQALDGEENVLAEGAYTLDFSDGMRHTVEIEPAGEGVELSLVE